MKLIGRYASPYVRRVAVTLQLYDLPYEHQSVMPFGEDQSVLKGLNPINRVPVLQLDHGENLVDSAAIIDHLDTLADPAVSLMPSLASERRRVLTLLAVTLGSMEKLVAALYERHFRPPDKQYAPWIERCEKQVNDGFTWLDGEFSGPCLTGQTVTQADVTLAVFWLFGKAKRPGFFSRLDCPNIENLSATLASTPAFQATTPEPQKLSADLSSNRTDV